MTDALTRRNALTGAAVLGLGLPTLAACSSDSPSSATDPAANGSTDASGGFATTGEVPEGSGKIFADQGVVVTQPNAGDFKAFTNICTHQGCPVADVTDTINCTCHSSQFSITDGSVVAGPAPAPLAAVPVTVKGTEISKA